jgi:hypothetical protein
MKTRFTRRPLATLQPTSVNSLADLIGGLQKSVGQRLTREFRETVPVVLIHRALDDAAELAHSTEFPHLFFPALAEEKVRLVSAALRPDSAPVEWLRTAA